MPPHRTAGGKVVRSTKRGRDRRSRKVLRIDRPHGGRVLKIDAAWAARVVVSLWDHSVARVQRVQRVRPAFGRLVQRVMDCPTGNAYKVSVTDLPFCVIRYDRHSADWLATLATPYPAAPDFPLCRGQNKTPRNTLFINSTTISTGYCATVEVLHRTSKWGEVRRLACPLRRFPFAAPSNCGRKGGTQYQRGPRVMVAADAAGCVEGLYFASLRGRQRLRR